MKHILPILAVLFLAGCGSKGGDSQPAPVVVPPPPPVVFSIEKWYTTPALGWAPHTGVFRYDVQPEFGSAHMVTEYVNHVEHTKIIDIHTRFYSFNDVVMVTDAATGLLVGFSNGGHSFEQVFKISLEGIYITITRERVGFTPDFYQCYLKEWTANG